LHLLFGAEADIAACAAGLMLRHTVQFHWTNAQAGQTSTPSWPAWRRTSARRSGRSGARWPKPA
jgi:hypothetical protein